MNKCGYECPSWWNCPKRGCYMEAKARAADYRPRDWSQGSDYSWDGRNLYCDTTRGTVLITTFQPGEKIG